MLYLPQKQPLLTYHLPMVSSLQEDITVQWNSMDNEVFLSELTSQTTYAAVKVVTSAQIDRWIPHFSSILLQWCCKMQLRCRSHRSLPETACTWYLQQTAGFLQTCILCCWSLTFTCFIRLKNNDNQSLVVPCACEINTFQPLVCYLLNACCVCVGLEQRQIPSNPWSATCSMPVVSV